VSNSSDVIDGMTCSGHLDVKTTQRVYMLAFQPTNARAVLSRRGRAGIRSLKKKFSR
jgi:hypothetical protein